MGSMGKGQIWINGQNVGRYWPAYKATGDCGDCNYAGTYGEKKCLSNCGEPSQRWWVKKKKNKKKMLQTTFWGDMKSLTN